MLRCAVPMLDTLESMAHGVHRVWPGFEINSEICLFMKSIFCSQFRSTIYTDSTARDCWCQVLSWGCADQVAHLASAIGDAECRPSKKGRICYDSWDLIILKWCANNHRYSMIIMTYLDVSNPEVWWLVCIAIWSATGSMELFFNSDRCCF